MPKIINKERMIEIKKKRFSIVKGYGTINGK